MILANKIEILLNKLEEKNKKEKELKIRLSEKEGEVESLNVELSNMKRNIQDQMKKINSLFK